MRHAAPAHPELGLDDREEHGQDQGEDLQGLLEVVEGRAARVHRHVAQVFLDAQQLVVLGHAVRARQRAGLDLAGVQANGDVGNGVVLGLARAVRDDRGVAGALGHLDGGEGLGQCADLVDLDQDRVGDALVDAFLQDLGVGDEEVVTHQLHLAAQHLGDVLPAVPVAFGHAVFDRDDGVFVDPGGQHAGPFLRAQLDAAFAFEHVFAVLVELAGGAVQGQGDLLSGGVAGLVDGLQDQLDRGLVALDAGREAALVTDGGGDVLVVQDLLQRMEDLGAPAQGLAEARRAHRDDHQLLQVQAVVGMGAAVDDVHHRHRQLVAVHAAEVAVQRKAGLFGGGTGHGHRDGQHRVGAQAALVLGAVQVDQGLVEEGLLGGVQAQHGLADLGVDVLDGLEHALAQVAGLVAVTQLDRFAAAGGCTRRHGRAAHHARLQQHVALDGGVAAAVEDLSADDVNNGAHSMSPGSEKRGRAQCAKGALPRHINRQPATPSTTTMRITPACRRSDLACW
mmetsp:Transcript_81542/g.226847  ORF Transcript_81542/g.226847 Transcript_81542/m.226847 type:complete len:508 (+) Transcript_81542:825-2348(+)